MLLFCFFLWGWRMKRFLPMMCVLLLALPAMADDCPADPVRKFPKAREGALAYSYVDKCYFVCNGTAWVSQCTARRDGILLGLTGEKRPATQQCLKS